MNIPIKDLEEAYEIEVERRLNHANPPEDCAHALIYEADWDGTMKCHICGAEMGNAANYDEDI